MIYKTKGNCFCLLMTFKEKKKIVSKFLWLGAKIMFFVVGFFGGAEEKTVDL